MSDITVTTVDPETVQWTQDLGRYADLARRLQAGETLKIEGVPAEAIRQAMYNRGIRLEIKRESPFVAYIRQRLEPSLAGRPKGSFKRG